MQPRITACVIARNEAKNIVPCLESLAWADERLVLDSFSHDNTVALARQEGARVEQRVFDNFAAQRDAALDLSTGDWVLFVDADERVSRQLAAEARAAVQGAEEGWQEQGKGIAGYWLPRRNVILGRWIKGGGWYPDYQLRLLRRGFARYDKRHLVHETVLLDGGEGRLDEALLHYNYTSLWQLLSKQRAYVSLEAQSLYEKGARGRPHSIVLQPLREFWRRFVSLKGWRDGRHGLLLALLMAAYNGVAYYKVWRLRRAESKPRH